MALQQSDLRSSLLLSYAKGVNGRHSLVLRLLIDGYIQKNLPISSRYITEQPDISFSSATIRSIFSDLESMGYIFSPHRSAGRLPTSKGYCFYADWVLSEHSPFFPNYIKKEDQHFIQKAYLKKTLTVDNVLNTSTKILSILTGHAAIVMGHSPASRVLKHLEFIDMGVDEILILLVTRDGSVFSRKVCSEEHLAESTLRSAARRLNHAFKGKELYHIRKLVQDRLETEKESNIHFLMRLLIENFDLVMGSETVYQEGTDLLYMQMSERKIHQLKKLIDEKILNQMIHQAVQSGSVGVLIGSEADKELEDISVICGSYKVGESYLGSLSVIGPNRMNYCRVIALVEYVRLLTSKILTRMSN